MGLGFSYLAAGLACSIACAGNGFLALVVLYLGLGGLAGRIYFLGRALRKDLKYARDMTREERRTEGRRFFRPRLIVAVAFTLFALAGGAS